MSIKVARATLSKAPPLLLAEFPLSVQSNRVNWPRLYTPPPLTAAVLPLIVTLSSVMDPKLYTPPPLPVVAPPEIVSPEIDTACPNCGTPTRVKTRLCPLPLTVSSPAPGPLTLTVPAWLVRSSGPCARVIVAGVFRLKLISLTPVAASACSTAQRSVPAVGLLAGALSAVLVTVNVDIRHRSSSRNIAGLSWRRVPAQLRPRVRPPLAFRSQSLAVTSRRRNQLVLPLIDVFSWSGSITQQAPCVTPSFDVKSWTRRHSAWEIPRLGTPRDGCGPVSRLLRLAQIPPFRLSKYTNDHYA